MATAESIFTLPKALPRDRAIERVAGFASLLPQDKAWRVTVAEQKRPRTQQQNRYLWGVAYPAILAGGGEALAGWDAEDLHEYFLGEHFGWETIEGFGRKRIKPLRRSAKLTTLEFSDHVAFIQRKAAEFGVYVPGPGGRSVNKADAMRFDAFQTIGCVACRKRGICSAGRRTPPVERRKASRPPVHYPAMPLAPSRIRESRRTARPIVGPDAKEVSQRVRQRRNAAATRPICYWGCYESVVCAELATHVRRAATQNA